MSQIANAIPAKAMPTPQTAPHPPALQAIEPAAEPIAPPMKFEVT